MYSDIQQMFNDILKHWKLIEDDIKMISYFDF